MADIPVINIEDLQPPPYNARQEACNTAMLWSNGHLDYTPVGPDKDRRRLLDAKADFLRTRDAFNQLCAAGHTNLQIKMEFGPVIWTFSIGKIEQGPGGKEERF